MFLGGAVKAKILFLFLSLFILNACSARKVVVKVKNKPVVSSAYKSKTILSPKKKIAVTTFENNTRFGKRRLGQNISDILITELSKTGRFIVLERSRVDDIMSQVALSQAGITSGNLEQVELLDTDYIITGAVSKYAVSTVGNSNLFTQSKTQKASVAVDVRIIDVRTGEVLLAESGAGMAQKEFSRVLGMGSSGGYDESLEADAFRAAVVQLMENIVRTLDQRPWSCNVVKLSGNKLYLDAGKKSNLALGTGLTVYQLGEKITDLSGKLIGYEEENLGTVRVERYIGENGSVAVYEGAQPLALPLVCRLSP